MKGGTINKYSGTTGISGHSQRQTIHICGSLLMCSKREEIQTLRCRSPHRDIYRGDDSAGMGSGAHRAGVRSAGGAEEPDGWGPLGPERWGPGGCTMYILRSLLQRCLGCSY